MVTSDKDLGIRKREPSGSQVTPTLPSASLIHQNAIVVMKKGEAMPEKSTVERSKQDLREGKSPTTAAGEFVHEEIEHVRRGKHGARSPQQAIAIGLSKARRAGVPLPPPSRGKAKEKTRRSAESAYRKGQAHAKRPARKRSRAREDVLKREPRTTVSRKALSRQARTAASRRKPGSRARSAKRAAMTRRRAA
jgi:hypothetical protein